MIARRRCAQCGRTSRILYRAQVCSCQVVMGDRAPLDEEIARFWDQWHKRQIRTHVENSTGDTQ